MTDLRDIALASKAWPYEEARRLLKRYPNGKADNQAIIFECGYGPSGLPHIGTFNEVLHDDGAQCVPDHVRRALALNRIFG